MMEELRASRQFIVDSWQKSLRGEDLVGVARQIVEIIGYHPEYHAFLASTEALEYQGDDNPFLHLGLHIALTEQISINQPAGIKERYQTLCQQSGDPHFAAHQLMDCLNATLQDAFERGIEPNPAEFLRKIDDIIFRHDN